MTDQNTNTTNSDQGFCAACGNKLPADSTFCPSCGVRIAHEIPANVIVNEAPASADDSTASTQQAATDQAAPASQPTPQPSPEPTDTADEASDEFVESASAISDPARNKSGSLAWIITGVVLVCVIVLSFGVSSCTSGLVSAGLIAAETSRNNSRYTDIQDIINQQDDGTGTTTKTTPDTKRDTNKNTSSLSAQDIASYDFYLFDGGISEEISASDYSGATADVSAYVKNICSIDKTYNDKVVLALRSIARDESTVDEQVKEIRDCVDNAKKEFSAASVPTPTGDFADDCAKYMDEAKKDAAERWDSMSTLADYLADPSKVKRNQLSSLDSQMNSHTSDAGLALYSSLLWSSSF